MSLAGWLTAGTVGLLAGGLSGLIGIGGGAIMVPFLYFFYAHPGLFGALVPEAQHAVIAHATSLTAIVPISLRGVWIYHRVGLVDWRTVRRLAVPAALAAVLGARLAVALPTETLKGLFGAFLIAAAVRLMVARSAEDEGTRMTNAAYTLRAVVGGAGVGLLSALLGVGGGIAAIPVLIHLLRLPLRRVSATSLAVIATTAATGVAAYGASGWTAGSDGFFTYIDLRAAVALVVGALLSVRLGTVLQRRLPVRALRWLFVIVFLLLGGRLMLLNLLRLTGAS